MADTNNTINQFFSNAVSRDFSRDIYFRVSQIVFSNGLSLDENQLIYARSASLPARKIGNVEAKYAGLTFNLPGTVSFPGSDSYEIEFYCDERSELRSLFLRESERTFNHIDGTADSGIGGGTIANGLGYIQLEQLDKQLNVVDAYKLVGTSIREVGNIDYAIADGSGAIMNFKVQIAYHYFNQGISGGGNVIGTQPTAIANRV